MKIIVLSDSHDNIVRLKHVIGFGETIKADSFIHCGDWNTILAVKQFDFLKIPIYGVLGNADISIGSKLKTKNSKLMIKDDLLDLKIDKLNLLVCHYPPLWVAPKGQISVKTLQTKGIDFMFHGHTHVQRQEKFGKTLVVNPGALQKTDSPSFAVLDTTLKSVEFVNVAN